MTQYQHFRCQQCGSDMDYAMGQNKLKCISCGALQVIAEARSYRGAAHNYKNILSQLAYLKPSATEHELHCQNCGASFIMDKDLHAGECPYCDLNVVVPAEETRQLKPDAVVPFVVDKEAANNSFRQWLGKLWFAPSSLKRKAFKTEPIMAVYTPLWSFDADVNSSYSGRRGDHYTTYRTVTRRINGRNRTSSEPVVKIRWRSVSGRVFNAFRYVYTLASRALPEKFLDFLSQWDLTKAQDYNAAFLSGYRSQLYQVGIDVGFGQAKRIMEGYIRNTIRRDIGGDLQEIHQVNSSFSDIGFRLILTPVYVASFSYKEKIYRYVVNGQNGKTYGERPWSWLKIISTIVMLAIVFAGIFFYQQ